jgi:hypothetical protein
MEDFNSNYPAKLIYNIEMYTRSIEEKYHQIMWESLGDHNILYEYLKDKFVIYEIPPFDTTIYPGYYSNSLKTKLKNDFKNSFFGQLGPNMTSAFFQKVECVVNEVFNPEKWKNIQKQYEEDLDNFNVLLAEKFYSLPNVSEFIDFLDNIVINAQNTENPEEYFRNELKELENEDINNLWIIKRDEILPDIEYETNNNSFEYTSNGIIDEMNKLFSIFNSNNS